MTYLEIIFYGYIVNLLFSFIIVILLGYKLTKYDKIERDKIAFFLKSEKPNNIYMWFPFSRILSFIIFINKIFFYKKNNFSSTYIKFHKKYI